MGESAYVSTDGTLRVVEGADGRPVIELADGADATGETRWIAAVVRPDRLSNGFVYLWGWRDIADSLGVLDEHTAISYARRRVNPLPVRMTPQGRPIISELLCAAWITDDTLPYRFVGEAPKMVQLQLGGFLGPDSVRGPG